jgi:RNA polymerase sigma-70 factor (ECF subfamily)
MIESKEDIDKFSEIYEAHKSMMYGVIFSILKNKEDSEDVLQEAFLKLAKNICKIDDISSKKAKAYLVSLCRSVSIDFYRKHHHERDRINIGDENDMDSLESSIIPEVLNEIISAEGYNRLVALIEEMSDTYKDAMKFRFVLGLSNGEIAELLNISKNAVEFRISRGRTLLAEMLRKEIYYGDKQ